MVTEVLGLLVQMFSDLLGLFDEVFTELGAWSYVLGAFLVFTIYRLLLVPIVGGLVRSGQSDIVKKIKTDSGFSSSKKNSGGNENG